MNKGVARSGPHSTAVADPIKRQSGFTLVELLIVMVITAILASALAAAFSAALTLERSSNERRATQERTDQTEAHITRLLQGARLAPSTSDQTTYFLGIVDSQATPLGSDRLTFTTAALGVPMAAMAGTDDFEVQQQTIGPVGGLAEVSLGTTAVGDPQGQSGLFERIQRPSDSDPTRGGMESLLDPAITSIGFQFWNGTQWMPTWDTTTSRQLPQAVRVTYTTLTDAGTETHGFIVPLRASSEPTDQSPSGGSPAPAPAGGAS